MSAAAGLPGPARRDFIAILAYVARQSGSRSVALSFVGGLRAQCQKLASLPGMLGQARPDLLPGVRSFSQGNYLIFFRYEENRLEVVNVIEGHRDIAAHFARDRNS